MNEYELIVTSNVKKEYFIEALSYEDAIQKAVDYYMMDLDDDRENKITDIKIKLKNSDSLDNIDVGLYAKN